MDNEECRCLLPHPLFTYVDDYLTMGPPRPTVCQQDINIFIFLCTELGFPLAVEKSEGMSTSLSFLGIILDMERMETRLPADKLARIK